MAYVQAANDPTMEAQAPGGVNAPMAQLPQTSSGTGGGAVAANTSVAGSPQGAASVPNSTKAPPPPPDLKAYLEANAPQAAGMGQNIATGLTDTTNRVTGDINAAQQSFDASVQGQNTNPNPDLVARAAANPADFVQNPDDLAAFLAQENANYTGPANYESTDPFSNLMQEVQDAQSQAPDITKAGGLEQLVRSLETNPTMGMTNLDTLLLSGTPGATAPITTALPGLQNLSGALQTSGSTEDEAIYNAVLNDINSQEGVQNTFLNGSNAVVPAWEQTLRNTLSSDTASQNAYNDALNNLITEENAANPDINAVRDAIAAYNTAAKGYNPTPVIGEGTSSLPQINDSDFTFNNPAFRTEAPTLNSVASSKDVATQNALEQLLGANFTPYLTDTTRAGSFVTPGTVPTESSLLQDELARLEADLGGANNAFTVGGKLAPEGTPEGNILTGKNPGISKYGDLPVGYSIIYDADPGSSHGNVHIPPNSGWEAIRAAGDNAIPIGNNPLTGQPMYAVPGQIAQKAANGKVPATYYPETTAGHTNLSSFSSPTEGSLVPIIKPTTYTQTPSQLTNLQKALQTLESYLTSQSKGG